MKLANKLNAEAAPLPGTESHITSDAKGDIYFYTAYGLRINSTLPIPELLSSNHTEADVVIRFGKLDKSPLKDKSIIHSYKLTADGMYLFLLGAGTFLIRNGNEIIIEPEPDASASKIRLLLLGAAIGTLLHQRGYLTLHASAVAMNNGAVVFIGDKGWGKSTIAANLHARGHNLIADDVVAVDLHSEQQAIVLPAFPQLKLWPDAVTSLGSNPEELPQLVSNIEKRDFRPNYGFMLTNIPLKQIYVLGKGEAVEIKPLNSQEVLTYLIRNSYITRFGEELIQSDRASYFRKLTQLAKKVSISYLLRPKDLSLLPETVRLIEENQNDYN
ncbi:hypothetical protein NIES4071_28920 [Calothrix sp. NIES-4071]|nr:hypothetical protein NIES4071_28920 [Calothrix sp. NIES-4071]BAZ57213.1 hypothetical protein NIES4105_28860 [Calothrix sp. NIES-4105]